MHQIAFDTFTVQAPRGWGDFTDTLEEENQPYTLGHKEGVGLAAASFDWGNDFVRVWQVSDVRNFALVTYTCDSKQAGQEVGVCEAIVRSIVFC